MQYDNRDPVGIAALFDIDAMVAAICTANINHALIERVDRRVKIFDCALLA